MRLGSRNRQQGDRRNRQIFLKRQGVQSIFSEKAALCDHGCETLGAALQEILTTFIATSPFGPSITSNEPRSAS
jgi:hypothetical protein